MLKTFLVMDKRSRLTKNNFVYARKFEFSHSKLSSIKENDITVLIFAVFRITRFWKDENMIPSCKQEKQECLLCFMNFILLHIFFWD